MALLPPDVTMNEMGLDSEERAKLNAHYDLCEALGAIATEWEQTIIPFFQNLPNEMAALKIEEKIAEKYNRMQYERKNSTLVNGVPVLRSDAPPYQPLPQVGDMLDNYIKQSLPPMIQSLNYAVRFVRFIQGEFCSSRHY